MNILFFAQIKDAAGMDRMDLTVAGQPDTAQLWSHLCEALPLLQPYRQSTRLAKNGEYAGADTRFCNQDEVALIPPVSGG